MRCVLILYAASDIQKYNCRYKCNVQLISKPFVALHFSLMSQLSGKCGLSPSHFHSWTQTYLVNDIIINVKKLFSLNRVSRTTSEKTQTANSKIADKLRSKSVFMLKTIQLI